MQIEAPEPPMPFKTWLEIYDNLEAMFPREEITNDFLIVLTKHLDRRVRDLQNGMGRTIEKGEIAFTYAQLKTYALGELLEERFTQSEWDLFINISNQMKPYLQSSEAEDLFNLKEKLNNLTVK